jgi:hypothetical protein
MMGGVDYECEVYKEGLACFRMIEKRFLAYLTARLMRSPSLNVEISRSKGQVQQILTGFYMVK